MQNIIKMLTIILSLALLASSCHKDTTKPKSIASKYFPNTVGDYWEYDVYDSSEARGLPYSNYPRNYTVKVQILGIKKLVDGNEATIWEYQYPWGKELNYIRISGDTIKIFDTVYSKTVMNLQFPRELYIFPFMKDETWNGQLLWLDEYSVSSVSSLATGWGRFTDCFLIFHHYKGPNIEYNDQYWLKPNIGFLKKYKHQYNLGPLDIELWQLKKYYLQ